jgi:hypothetical protein
MMTVLKMKAEDNLARLRAYVTGLVNHELLVWSKYPSEGVDVT